MANGERDYEYIQVGGKQGLTPMPTGQVTNTPMPTDIVQGGTLNQLINDSQGAGVVQATGGQVQPIVNDFYPQVMEGYDPLSADPTVQAYDPLIEAQRGATSPGALPQTTYTPGINRPITAGGYSGRVIGNTTFFAPQGQVVPLGIIDAREKAMQEAAMKAAELEKQQADAEAKLNIFKIPTAPELSNKNYQRTYNKRFNNYVNEYIQMAQEKFGPKDWARGLQDPNNEMGRNFQQGLAQFDYIAKHGNQITQEVAELQKKIDDGEMQTTPYIRGLMRDVDNAMGSFESGDPQDLMNAVGRVQAVKNLDNYLNKNKIVTAEMRDIQERLSKKSNLEYDTFQTEKRKMVDAAANRLADQMIGDGGAYQDAYQRGLMPRQAIVDAVKARLGESQEIDIKTVGTSKRAEDYYKDKDMNNPILVQGSELGFEAENIIPLDNKTIEGGLTFSWDEDTVELPDGTIVEGKGERKTIGGDEQVTFNRIENDVVTDEEGNTRLKSYVVVTATKKDGSDVITREEKIPYENQKMKAFMSGGKYRKAAEFNEKVNKDWNTGSYSVIYDNKMMPLDQYQDRSTDYVERQKGAKLDVKEKENNQGQKKASVKKIGDVSLEDIGQ